MDSFLEIANSPILLIIVTIPILWVTGQAVGFLRMGLKEAKKQDIPQEKVKQTIVNCALFSIVPSLPVILTLAVMMAIMGPYIPWMRMSVMGSPAYEAFAAEITIRAFGLEGGLGYAQLTPTVFVSMIWVMTTAILVAPVVNILFLRKYDMTLKKLKTKGGFMAIASGAMMIGLLCTMFMPEVVNFGRPIGILAGVTAGISALVIDHIAKRSNEAAKKTDGKAGKAGKILAPFAFPLSMLLGMAAAVIASGL